MGAGTRMVFGQVEEKTFTLFDFETPGDIAKWEPIELVDKKEKDPAVKLELSNQNVSSGRNSLKLIFPGGKLPGIMTRNLPDTDYFSYKTFKADVAVSRTCVLVFRVVQEMFSKQSAPPGAGYRETASRWVKLARLEPGMNHIEDEFILNTNLGKAVRFEIYAYHPKEGESLFIDNIRLESTPPKTITPFNAHLPYVLMKVPKDIRLPVLGTDLMLSDLNDLGKKYENTWVMPTEEPKTVEEADGEIKKAFDEIKKSHPQAVSAVFCEGDTLGKDDKPYVGWKDCYIENHPPAANTLANQLGVARGKEPTMVLFFRGRCALMQVDLSSIPAGAKILSARLMLVRAKPFKLSDPKQGSPAKPTMWVAEPCNREWVETEANGVEYARDKFWKQASGMGWEGPDPDFSPIVIAFGHSTGNGANTWNFTEAIRYWTEGGHPNHGFVFYPVSWDYSDYFTAFSREALDVKNRPAMYVLYESGKK